MAQDASSFAVDAYLADGPTIDSFAMPAAVRRPPGLTLRHLATLVLMLVLVPVFIATAIVTMPLALIGGLAEALRSSWTTARIGH